jgi:PAS domain S-box-containing protein
MAHSKAADHPSGEVPEDVPFGLAVIETPGTITWANPAYFSTTGRDASILGTDFHAILESDGTWALAVRTAVDAALADRKSTTFHSIRARYRAREDGVYLDVDVRPLGPPGRAPARALLVIRDVSDRVLEHARAQLFYQAFLTSTDAMELTDPEGIIVDVNPAFERIYGYARHECIGRKPNIVSSPETPPSLYETMWSALLDPKRGAWSGELVNRDRGGTDRPVQLSITAIRDQAGTITHYLGVVVDLSEQRKLELRAAHSDKLASIGQLAAGVAHEINTPLANVMLIAESLRRRTTDPWALARIDTLSNEVDVAARIVRSLLDFARRNEPRTTEVDLTTVSRESVAFLRGKQSADIDIEEEYPPQPVLVHGDRGQLMQVMTNLLNNACDAMNGKGTIRISVRQRGHHAEVEVLDHGPGISAEVLPHIFEPFFTTKPEGQGTGLGLAICHGIIQSHHGTIVARNDPEAGASFLITLPLNSTDEASR